MTMRTEKELRAEFADKKLAPATIDALVKAEKEAGLLKGDLEEDDEDEGADYDAAGEALKKAREAAAADLVKAETVKVDAYTVADPVGSTSPDPEQRHAADRTPVDPNIDAVTPDETLRDIAKAFNDASAPRFKALTSALTKAYGEGLKTVVGRLEARLSSQDKLIGAVLGQNELLLKAMRKQGKGVRDLQKALDTTPAPRKPGYRIEDVQALPRPGDPPPKNAQVNIDDLSKWITNELAKAAEGETGLEQRQRVDVLYNALGYLDAGTRTPDQIAKAIGFKA